jgi:hypothetical protein
VATTVHVKVVGGRRLRAGLKRHIAALDAGLKRGVDKGAREYGRAIRENLRLKTHPVGTATPSAPGEPPALMTGHMMRSVKHRGARRLRAHVFMASTGPTAVQSRIQEKGGWTGASHRTYLPPRPYVGPAVRIATPKVREIIRREVSAALQAVH